MSRLMREGLAHTYPGLPCEDFFTSIDKTGGWPVGYGFVGFQHTEARLAGFTNTGANDGWWTVVASADDYFLWKLSPAALQRITDSVTASLPRPGILAKHVRFVNSSGRRATVAKMEGGVA